MHETRVLDVDLAKMLGYSRLRSIRKVIRTHLAALEKLGPVETEQRKPGGRKGGRPETAYHLTQAQALYVATRGRHFVFGFAASGAVTIPPFTGEQA